MSNLTKVQLVRVQRSSNIPGFVCLYCFGWLVGWVLVRGKTLCLYVLKFTPKKLIHFRVSHASHVCIPKLKQLCRL